MSSAGEHPSDYVIEMTYDDGQVHHLPYCRKAVAHFLAAHAEYGAPFDDSVMEVKITRRGVAN